MDKKLMVFVAAGLVGLSVFCGLLASGGDGYHYQLGPIKCSFGVWKECIGDTCNKYDLSGSGSFKTRIMLARTFYILQYFVGGTACFALLASVLIGEFLTIIAVLTSGANALLLILADLCQSLAYDKVSTSFGSAGYSSIIPWIGVAPALLGALMSVYIKMRM